MGLRAQDQILSQNMSIIQNNLSRLRTFFNARGSYFAWEEPTAGTVGFPRLLKQPGYEVDVKSDVAKFTEDVVAKSGVLLLPATVYGHEESVRRGHFRIGFGRKNAVESLTKLEEYLDRIM